MVGSEALNSAARTVSPKRQQRIFGCRLTADIANRHVRWRRHCLPLGLLTGSVRRIVTVAANRPRQDPASKMPDQLTARQVHILIAVLILFGGIMWVRDNRWILANNRHSWKAILLMTVTFPITFFTFMTYPWTWATHKALTVLGLNKPKAGKPPYEPPLARWRRRRRERKAATATPPKT